MKYNLINKNQLNLSSTNSHSLSTTYNLLSTKNGFTIVELLVVIVVIGILASITIVSYTGITQKAIAATLQSDLSNASKQLSMYNVLYDSYPTTFDGNGCPTAPVADTKYCIKTSGSNALLATNGYTVNNSASPRYFSLIAANNTTTYRTTSNTAPAAYTSLATTYPANWIAIGTQVWAKANLNVGTRINGAVAQTNNAILEKYCYSDLDANCTTYGALYQWDEAMQYVVTAGAQGICPAGSHITTDAEWKILEMQLGMTQSAADAAGWRGTDQGSQLKSSGQSGFSMLFGGYRNITGFFGAIDAIAHIWSSSESTTTAYDRRLDLGLSTVYRTAYDKTYGFSVRCIGN